MLFLLNPAAGKGKGLTFLRSLVGHQGTECVPWPFSCDDTGYGQCGAGGQLHKANRLMCYLENGSPPTRDYEAAHECGNRGCVNPRHLSWKTRSENGRDMVRHGTAPKGGRRRKLSDEQVAEIRALYGQKTLREIGADYGVSYKTVSNIHNMRTRIVSEPT